MIRSLYISYAKYTLCELKRGESSLVEEDHIHQIVRSFREVNRVLYLITREEADKLDLTMMQLFVLQSLKKKPDISLGELADLVQVGNSTMSGIVERLVKLGLITRQRSETDRRSLVMRLTPEGEEKQQATYILFKERLSPLLEIPEEDLNWLLQLHDQILNKIKIKGG